MDIYKNFNHLSESLTIIDDYLVEYYKHETSKVLIMTPHGGGIEPGTTELVKEIASTDMSWYSFTAVKSKHNNLLHITSTNFDEPKCLSLVSDSTTTLAIHGCEDKEQIIYVGGLDTEISYSLYENFKNKLSHLPINIVNCGRQYYTSLPGINKNNIVNKNAIRAGVQLEFSYGLRKLMFENVDKRLGRINKNPLFWEIVTIIRETIYPQLFESM